MYTWEVINGNTISRITNRNVPQTPVTREGSLACNGELQTSSAITYRLSTNTASFVRRIVEIHRKNSPGTVTRWRYCNFSRGRHQHASLVPTASLSDPPFNNPQIYCSYVLHRNANPRLGFLRHSSGRFPIFFAAPCVNDRRRHYRTSVVDLLFIWGGVFNS